MQASDWLERWNNNRIGFHDAGVNTYLRQFLDEFNLRAGDTVFMPLCGKSNDIAWLAEQGFKVVGVELSAIAIESFFSEHGLSYQQFQSDRFVVYECGNIRLLEGDFFNVRRDDLINCNLVYDRASLIAIDENNRARYCEHLLSIITTDTALLLISLDYDQSIMQGPPFSVSPSEISRHFASSYDIQLLEQKNVIDEQARWRDQGLTQLTESIYRLNRKPGL